MGFLTFAHAGEEGPAEYVWDALNNLSISRIDHGNRSLDDDQLIEELAKRKIPLTVCPLSNLKLKVVKELKNHPIRSMLLKGLLATVNSDDPAYFGGYLNENYFAITDALNLTIDEINKLAQNSIEASFLINGNKEKYISLLSSYTTNS